MANQNENKFATSLTSTSLPSPTSTFIPLPTVSNRLEFDTAEHSQSILSGAPCPQVSHKSSDLLLSAEPRRPDQLQASNSAERVAEEDSPSRSQASVFRSPRQDTHLSRSQRSTAVTSRSQSLHQNTRVPHTPRSPDPDSSSKPEFQGSRAPRTQSLRSIRSASSFRVPTRLSSLGSNTSISIDSFNTTGPTQAPVPAFLGRHCSSRNTQGVQRTVSLGSIAELHSTAQQSYSNRTFRLPVAKQRHSTSPALHRHLESDFGLIPSRYTSVTSVEDFEELLSRNEEVLFVDAAKRPHLGILFAKQTSSRYVQNATRRLSSSFRSQPTLHQPIPLVYRQTSAPNLSTARKQAVFVPLIVNPHLRQSTTSSMSTQGPSIAHGYAIPAQISQTFSGQFERNAVSRGFWVTYTEPSANFPAAFFTVTRVIMHTGPPIQVDLPLRGQRKWKRKVANFGRRLVGKPKK